MPVTVCGPNLPSYPSCEVVATLTEALGHPGPLELEVSDGVYVEGATLEVPAGLDATIRAAAGASVSVTTSGGGPVFSVTGGALTLVDISAVKVGSRVFSNEDGLLDVTGGVFYSLGLVSDGGVLWSAGGEVRLTGARFLSSVSAGDGGLVAVTSATLTVSDTTFRGGFAQRGGAVWIEQGNLPARFTNCTFEANEAAADGGAISSAAQARIEVTGSRFVDNRAVRGGAVAMLARSIASPLVVADTEFVGNTALDGGGALEIQAGRTATVSRARFVENTATHGAGIAVTDGGTTFDEVLFCGNTATLSGGAVAVSGAAGHQWRHARFVANTAGRGGALLLGGQGTVGLQFGSFLANRAEAGAAVLVERPATSAAFDAVGLLVAFSRGDAAVRVGQLEPAPPLAITHSLWFDNPIGHLAADNTEPLVVADPRLYAFDPAAGCDALFDAYPPDSPLVDVVPGEEDPDGTRADAGPWGGYGGGSSAALPAPWLDGDNDGVEGVYDCDDELATVHPPTEADPDPEQWYDGIDGDCDGASDFDADRDGFDAVLDCDDRDAGTNPAADDTPNRDRNCDLVVDGDQDGFEPPFDCDDSDPDAFPGAPENPSLFVDADCDGFVEAPGTLTAVRCDTGGGGGGLLVVGALAALARRRRR